MCTGIWLCREEQDVYLVDGWIGKFVTVCLAQGIERLYVMKM